MKTVKINPAQYFSEWHFDIHDAHWAALGVKLREYIDKEKTKIKRAAARESGTSEDAVKKIKVTYMAYAVSKPPNHDFGEGDIFHSRHTRTALQVVGSVSGDTIEVHLLCLGEPTTRQAFRVSSSDLSLWLMTGEAPSGKEITAFQSASETLRYLITQ